MDKEQTVALTAEETHQIESEIAELESTIKQLGVKALVPGIVVVVGLCLVGFSLGRIMAEGDFTLTLVGFILAIPGLVFAYRMRRQFDDTNRQLKEKREELARSVKNSG
jgi:ABC-type multidrug transport system fused ATPase/permease subunit